MLPDSLTHQSQSNAPVCITPSHDYTVNKHQWWAVVHDGVLGGWPGPVARVLYRLDGRGTAHAWDPSEGTRSVRSLVLS